MKSVHSNVALFIVLHLVLFFIIKSIGAVNLSCDSRLRECEREVKTLLKKNGECSSDLDALRVEISHLSEIISQYENDVKKGKTGFDQSLSWRVFAGHIKHFATFFKALIYMTYSYVPTEVDAQLRSAFISAKMHLKPISDRYREICPSVKKFLYSTLTKYKDFMDPYVAYIAIYSAVLNERLDRFVRKMESFEPRLVESIPKTLCDRVFYFICAVLALYALLELSCFVLRLVFKCFGIKCSCNATKKVAKSPSSKSTPSNRRR